MEMPKPQIKTSFGIQHRTKVLYKAVAAFAILDV